MAPRDFFVCLDMIYKHTDFHSSRAFGMAGLIVYIFLGVLAVVFSGVIQNDLIYLK